MKISRHLVASAVAILALSGAAPSTARAQIGVEVTINVAPPPRTVEVQYPAPGADYVWHRGDWVWNPEVGRFGWHPVHWVVHPEGFTIWHPGEWVNFAGSWHYVSGHWRTVAEGPAPDYIKLVDVVKEPPPMQAEVVPVAAPGYAWDRGHWAWDGAAYRWVRGHWLFVPREYHSWVPSHWYHSGNYWFFHNGYWH
jgi:hypothetical protein